MNTRTELLNAIAKKIGAKYYLEIGVFNRDHNFNKIGVDKRFCVDPDPAAKADFCLPSDSFFELTSVMFDVIFIDGLHHSEQVRKDIENSYARLNEGGVIVLHDCNPPSEATTCVPRGKQREWCGDVYKVICNITSPSFFTTDFDYGCTVIRKRTDPLAIADVGIDWATFDVGRKFLLNLKSADEVQQIIESWI